MILAPWWSKLPLVLRQGVPQYECGLCYQKEACTMRDLYKVSNAVSFNIPGHLHALGLPAARPISTSDFKICSYLRRFVLIQVATSGGHILSNSFTYRYKLRFVKFQSYEAHDELLLASHFACDRSPRTEKCLGRFRFYGTVFSISALTIN